MVVTVMVNRGVGHVFFCRVCMHWSLFFRAGVVGVVKMFVAVVGTTPVVLVLEVVVVVVSVVVVGALTVVRVVTVVVVVAVMVLVAAVVVVTAAVVLLVVVALRVVVFAVVVGSLSLVAEVAIVVVAVTVLAVVVVGVIVVVRVCGGWCGHFGRGVGGGCDGVGGNLSGGGVEGGVLCRVTVGTMHTSGVCPLPLLALHVAKRVLLSRFAVRLLLVHVAAPRLPRSFCIPPVRCSARGTGSPLVLPHPLQSFGGTRLLLGALLPVVSSVRLPAVGMSLAPVFRVVFVVACCRWGSVVAACPTVGAVFSVVRCVPLGPVRLPAGCVCLPVAFAAVLC